MNKPAAIYARVSSDRQKENHTIASQTAALLDHAAKNGYSVPPEWVDYTTPIADCQLTIEPVMAWTFASAALSD